MSSGGSTSNNIRVIARFRPLNSLEVNYSNGGNIVSIDESQTTCRVESKDYPGQFTFDRIFDWNCTQEDIFAECGEPLVRQCFEGFNSTLFCYGQTGAGKSYTMSGGAGDKKGIIPRIVERIFENIRTAPDNLEFLVKVSYMEIYMERIRDLLVPKNDNLPVHEDKTHGVFVKGLKEVYVSSIAEVYQILSIGEQSRRVASTNMNEQSSRSHSIFVLQIVQKDINTETARTGKLSLVDLAGSEKVGKTGATGQTLEEAKKINKSLTALGMVINSLTDGKSTHVPYRDSKLTRILQESLGGNSKTTLIVNCSPSSYNDAETISTLRFGFRAKNIKNSAHINVELSATELKALLKGANSEITSLQAYIANLEEELKSWRSGNTVNPEDYATPDFGNTSAISSSNIPKTPSKKIGSLATAPVSTPDVVRKMARLSVEEKDEFLKRENELVDQLAERESELDSVQKKLQITLEELQLAKENEAYLVNENKEMVKSLANIQRDVEKLSFDVKEQQITIETLREQNSKLESKSQQQQHYAEGTISTCSSATTEENINDSGKRMSDKELTELKRLKTEQMMKSLTSVERGLVSAGIDNESPSKNTTVSADTIAVTTPVDQSSMEYLRHIMSKQTNDFEAIKKSLMRDIQNRCQKVVELEILLDETHEKYQQAIRDNTTRSNDKKMAFLERNLEKLTKVQKQLVDQNADLKRKIAITERKVGNRNERIDDLEKILQDLSTKMGHESEKHEEQLRHYQKRITELEDQIVNTSHVGLQSGDGRIAKPLRGGSTELEKIRSSK